MHAPQSLTEELLFSTTRILASGPKRSGSGTGFFFQLHHPTDATKAVQAVITCGHVIKGARRGEFLIREARLENGVSVPSDDAVRWICKEGFQDFWIFHPDPNVDLCAAPVSRLIDLRRQEGREPYVKGPTQRDIWPDAKLQMLRAVEDVLMVGYPNGLWDDVNYLPLVRRGITATHPAVDFCGRSQGVVDIAAFPGSSGSPIAIAEDGLVTMKNGSVAVGRRYVLLGVLCAGPVITETGEIRIQHIPTSNVPVPVMQRLIHLGYYAKAKEVLVLMDELCRRLHIPKE
jgi:hypothetical protein